MNTNIIIRIVNFGALINVSIILFGKSKIKYLIKNKLFKQIFLNDN